MDAQPYIHGQPSPPGPPVPTPLARFLPPVPVGIGRTWLNARYPAGTPGTPGTPGAWILDPFGASPTLALELARAGYRVLVAANNPIVRFLLEMHATPPRRDELLAALEILASSRKGTSQTGERLEPHLLNLYTTICTQCEAEISADAFLWEKDGDAPYARIYHCPHCASSGEFPTTDADATRAAQFAPQTPTTALHRARALERVLPINDPDRESVEEALRVYPPRAVYALFTLINKLDGLPISPYQRNLLAALFLVTFDQTNTLWPHPTARARPKQLTVPPKFIEHNVWRALESAVNVWAGLDARATPLVRWPLPLSLRERGWGEGGGIALFEGRLKDLAESLPENISAVLTAIPRPNQAFWTLSALWAGWLWGPDAMGPFRTVLRRRRYDWAWHTEALHAALRRLQPRLTPETPLFALLPEAEPGLLTAALVAADMGQFTLAGLALREEDDLAQITWKTGGSTETMNLTETRRADIVRKSAHTYLRAMGEPVPYLPLQAAALTALAAQETLVPPALKPDDAYTHVRDLVEKTFTDANVARLGGSPHSIEVGDWWLEDTEGAETPLSDRVEQAMIRFLAEQPGKSLPEIDAAMCVAFPGLLTPAYELVCACLDSYGERHPVDKGWYLRGTDRADRRAGDENEMRKLLGELGKRLGYGVRGDTEVVWGTSEGEVARFGIQTSAEIGKLTGEPSTTPLAYLVIPGGRANLMQYKLRHDPRLGQVGWQFLKFRHVRQLADSAEITRENWQERFALDPLTYESAQMRLL